MVFNNNSEESTTSRITGFFKKTEVKYFIGGMVAAYAIKKVCETDAAHDFAVNATASVLDIKDSFEESIENIKEDAEDIHAEAQEKQQIEVFGPEDLIDDDEDIDVEFVKEE